jgi:hypothetical protein
MKYKDIFENDLKQGMHLMFSDMGVKIPIRRDLDEMVLDYLTVHKKLVHIKPRQVFVSPDLEAKLTTHPKQNEVAHLRRLLKIGRNVNFFQSKKLFQTRFHDHLLYEWNIFHFHLSTQLERGSKFVKQTNQLLFVYIDDNEAILLDIQNHTDGIFADEKWLEILDNSFPHILEPYIATDIVDISPNVNSVQRQNLWNNGLTLGMTKVNGKIFHSPGIGRATSGHSIIVAKTTNEILRWVHQITLHFDNKLIEICNAFEFEANTATFNLRFGDVTLEVVETKSNKVLLTYPYLFDFTDNYQGDEKHSVETT